VANAQVSDAAKSFCQTINGIGNEAAGFPAAIAALPALERMSASDGMNVLRGMDDQNPLAANWLRLSAANIFDRSPALSSDLRQLATDQSASKLSREAAFSLLQESAAQEAKSITPSFIRDPCLALRRFAVAEQIELANQQIEQGKQKPAQQLLTSTLETTRDIDQISAIIKTLNSLGQEVDQRQWLGLIMDWQIAGPFDNSGGIGFAKAYEPENQLAAPDFSASYPGKDGQVDWKTIKSDDRDGFVDINKLLAKSNGSCVYLAAPFNVEDPQQVEIRAGTYNAIKVWVNGQPIYDYEVYHTNEVIDQYSGKATLVAGTNWIVIKLCQNEQQESWAQNWRFLARVTDETGKRINVTK